MGGSSPQATPIQLSGGTPPKPPPGYGPVKAAFEQIFPQLFNMPLPSYGGRVDPGLSPTMQNLIRGAQSYSQSPFPQSLEQASGTLGKFQNFDKLPGANRPYEFDPSHGKMYEFQNPFLPNPAQAQGPPPQYGFNVQPQVPGMAEGGGAGYGAEEIVKMQSGGGGGPSVTDVINASNQMNPNLTGVPSPSQPVSFITPGNFTGKPGGPAFMGPGGYYYGPGGNLAFNPSDPSGMFSNSKFGRFFQWMANQGMFTPGQQHGPNAEFWDANPPSGFEGGRSGPINPTDPADPHKTPYGWWTADPSQLGGGQQMPPWLSGLNDKEMAYVFDLVGKVPEGMEQPWDWIAEQVAAEGLIDLPGPNVFSKPGKGRGGGGGGKSFDFNFQGTPDYRPMEVDSSFVGWDPGNPTPSMVPGNNLMPPMPPPGATPPPEPKPGGGGGGPGGGGGGGGRPRGPGGGPPAPAMGPGLPAMPMPMPMPFFPMHRGPGGGGGGMGFRPGGGDPGMGIGNEAAIPMFARGNVVDHPQLAMIGEAGPEVVMPLTRPAAHPGIRKMQDQLGLPAKPMQTGGAAGMGGDVLNYKPMPMPQPQIQQKPMPLPGSSPTLGRGRQPLGGGMLSQKPTQIPGARQGLGSTFQPMPLPFTPPPGMVGGFSNNRAAPPGGREQTPWQSAGFDSRRQAVQAARKAGWQGDAIGGLNEGLEFLRNQGGAGGPSASISPAPGGAGAVPGAPGQFDRMNRIPNLPRPDFGDLRSPALAPKPMPLPGIGPTLGTKPAQIPGGAPGGVAPPGGWEGNALPPPSVPGGSSVLPWQPQQNGLPQGQDPFSRPTRAMDVFRSAVPAMNDIMTQQIRDAAAQGGVTGNRFGTSTENNFANIGRQGGNQMNQLMGQLLYDQTNQDLNRSLQATGMGLEDARFRNQLGFQGEQNALDRAMQAAGLGGQFGQMQDQMAQDRLRLPFQIGAWEQGRQDQYARMPYDDFMQSRMGYLPYLFQLMSSQGGSGGMSPQFGVQQTGGSPGALDYISALAPIFMGMMAEGGAAGSGASHYLEGGY